MKAALQLSPIAARKINHLEPSLLGICKSSVTEDEKMARILAELEGVEAALKQKMFKYLLQQKETEFNFVKNCLLNETILKDKELVKFLVEQPEINLNCTDQRTKETPLHKAIRLAAVETYGLDELLIARDLLTRKGVILSADIEGNTPLHLAVQIGQESLVEKLLRMGADSVINVRNKAGNTPLHLVRDSASARHLLSYKPAINLLNNEGKKPSDCVSSNVSSTVGSDRILGLLGDTEAKQREAKNIEEYSVLRNLFKDPSKNLDELIHFIDEAKQDTRKKGHLVSVLGSFCPEKLTEIQEIFNQKKHTAQWNYLLSLKKDRTKPLAAPQSSPQASNSACPQPKKKKEKEQEINDETRVYKVAVIYDALYYGETTVWKWGKREDILKMTYQQMNEYCYNNPNTRLAKALLIYKNHEKTSKEKQFKSIFKDVYAHCASHSGFFSRARNKQGETQDYEHCSRTGVIVDRLLSGFNR